MFIRAKSGWLINTDHIITIEMHGIEDKAGNVRYDVVVYLAFSAEKPREVVIFSSGNANTSQTYLKSVAGLLDATNI